MATYCVYVKCIEKRWVQAEDPIDAVSKALHSKEDLILDEEWNFDKGVEHITVQEDDGSEKRVVMPNKLRGRINKVVRKGNEQKDLITGRSWSEIRKQDFDDMDTIHINDLISVEI